jgi:hypothetical protein
MLDELQSARALYDKYCELKRLRDEHDAGSRHDPRPALAALARRFPGALRELDELPMPELEAKLAALAAAVAGQGPVPAWALLQASYHGTMRAALRIKGMFARGVDPASALRELPARYVPAPDEPGLERLDLAALEAILRPHHGRLNPWVFECVAERHGVSAEQVRKALFRR